METQERVRILDLAWEMLQKYPPIITTGPQYNASKNQEVALEAFDKIYKAIVETVTS